MNYNLLLPLIITTCVAIVGWFTAHMLAAGRDRANKRRELIVQYLIDAYRNLEKFVERDESYKQDWSVLESAIADIYLFGSKKQVEKARNFVQEFAKVNSASLNDLLLELREDLRQQLLLEALPSDFKYPHLRIISNHVDGSDVSADLRHL